MNEFLFFKSGYQVMLNNVVLEKNCQNSCFAIKTGVGCKSVAIPVIHVVRASNKPDFVKTKYTISIFKLYFTDQYNKHSISIILNVIQEADLIDRISTQCVSN